ncbi:MAG: alpha/beta hydrolase [Ruminococcus sp.]|nr:alpha/beta hydrolase [Ruminococcus sp.]
MNTLLTVTETEYIHISRCDGLPLHVLRIEPADPLAVKGIVQIVHGKNEHKLRYRDFMRFMASRGYIAIANDHRGHGESVLSPEDRGYMYEGGYKALVRDVHDITLEVKAYAAKRCGRALPVFMLGHSMGSLAARCYIRKYSADIDKLCLTGSPSRSNKMMTGLAMLKLLEIFEGKKARSKFAWFTIMWLPYELRYIREGLHNSWTNSDRDAVIEQNNDPLCRFRFTLSAYSEMIKMALVAYSGGYEPADPSLPIRFFSGDHDPCMKSEKKLRQAVKILEDTGYTDVGFTLYKGLRHDILREKNKHLVYEDILKAIEE